MMRLYTIGFTKKSAADFFGLLKRNEIERLVDIRISPQGQLSGFARQEDLPYFLEELANHCRYIYMPVLAPTKEIMHAYRSSGDWLEYSRKFEDLLDERHIPEVLDPFEFESARSCFLCSEATADKCHRRLVVERLASSWPGVEIIHL